MTTPEKTDTITFTATTLGDSKLPITTFTKAELLNFLNGVTGDVALYFASAGDDSPNMFLMLAESIQGGISSTNSLQSGILPCPKYCKG